MLHSIKFTNIAAFLSRLAVANASKQRQICELSKCSYSTRSDELQKQIEVETNKGRDTARLKENLCNEFIAEKNVERIEDLLKMCTFGDLIHQKIIIMHMNMGSTVLALNHLNDVRKTRPHFKLNRRTAARLARAFLMEEREWLEITRVFTENKQLPMKGSNVPEISDFLLTATRSRSPAELNELFDVLIANNFMVKDTVVAGYLVKVHLVNNNLSGAMETFEKQFHENKFVAHNAALMVKLIETNDMQRLQRVFELVQSKYSWVNAVLALASSFIEAGNVGQARILLEDNIQPISDQEFHLFLMRCYHAGRYTVIKGFLEATFALDFDRSEMYLLILGYLCDQCKTDEALELWRQHLAQNGEPSDEFLRRLASHLTLCNRKIPFSLPLAATPKLPPYLAPAGIREMNVALKNQDVDAALNFLNEINPRSTQWKNLASDLVRALIKSNRQTEAYEVAVKSIDLNRRVDDQSLQVLIQRLADDGEQQLLERLDDLLPRTTKRFLQFGYRLQKAYEKSGNWNEFFSNTLSKKVGNANINHRIPMVNLLMLLQKQCIPLAEFKEFVESAVKAGIHRPLNVLWAHQFLNDSPESDVLYDRFERNYTTKFEMAFVARYLVEVADEKKLEQLLEFARDKNKEQLPAINIVALVTRMNKIG